MDLDIKWWKKKSLSWEPPQILCCELLHLLNEETTDFKWNWSSDPPLPRTLLSSGPWTQWQLSVGLSAHQGLLVSRSSSNTSLTFQEQEVVVMMQEVLGGQKDKGRHEDPCCPGLPPSGLLCSCVPEAPPGSALGSASHQVKPLPFRICSGISLSSGEAPPLQDLLWDQPLIRICSAISLSSGEAPPLQDLLCDQPHQDQDLLWDQPHISSSGEAPPLLDQDLLWDQPLQVKPRPSRICSGISLSSPSPSGPGSALGSASPGEAPPLQDLLWDQPLQVKPRPFRICSGISLSSVEAPPLQDLLWDQPLQVLSFRDIEAVFVEIKSELNPGPGVFHEHV
ncbi:hypothetical protein KUCAC02_033477 [Chaenocephalus aceratus]|nr:hypothetical protein KUCAC02_033477 [Chaenocephalus aceratus]